MISETRNVMPTTGFCSDGGKSAGSTNVRRFVGKGAFDSSGYATLMVEILKHNARPEAGEVYGAMNMGWAKLVGQIAQAYGK